jgi:hypothetical protein
MDCVSCMFGFKFGVGYLLCRCYWTCWLIIGNWRYCSMTVWSVTYRISVRCSSNLSLVTPRTCPLLSPSQVWSLSPWIMIYKICFCMLTLPPACFLPFYSFHSIWLWYMTRILIAALHTHTHIDSFHLSTSDSGNTMLNKSCKYYEYFTCDEGFTQMYMCYAKSVRNTVQ